MFPPKLFARRSCLLPLLLASTFTNSPADQRVRIWEETINLPTYKVAPAEERYIRPTASINEKKVDNVPGVRTVEKEYLKNRRMGASMI